MLVSPCKYIYPGMVLTPGYQPWQMGCDFRAYPCLYYYPNFYISSINCLFDNEFNDRLFSTSCLIRRMGSFAGIPVVGSSAPIIRFGPFQPTSLCSNNWKGLAVNRTEDILPNDNDSELMSIFYWKLIQHVRNYLNYLYSSAQQWALTSNSLNFEFKLTQRISCYTVPTYGGYWGTSRTRTWKPTATTISIQCMLGEEPSSGPLRFIYLSIFVCTTCTVRMMSVLYESDLMYTVLRVQQWAFSLICRWGFLIMLHLYVSVNKLILDLHRCHLTRVEEKCNLTRSEGMLFPSGVCLVLCFVFICLCVIFLAWFIGCSKRVIGCSKRVSLPQSG